MQSPRASVSSARTEPNEVFDSNSSSSSPSPIIPQQSLELAPSNNQTKHNFQLLQNDSSDNSNSALTISTCIDPVDHQQQAANEKRASIASTSTSKETRRRNSGNKTRIITRKFQKLELHELSSTPAPDVKIGQRVAYKEYYGNEFGTIRWIGRVPQICPDWTVGVEFDNAIGEGDGSLNGRRYFIAKDCFAKFLPLNVVACVDQHVGRPEPGTMISVMSATVRPGQMISIQRVSTVHVQHCFLNAPHRIPGEDILAVNTRLHCQCPNCGPCAHVIKPPRTQRVARSHKNATHMCQFSTYTCCGMESSDEALCTYEGNKISSAPPPCLSSNLPPIGNSWIEGLGYLSNLQAQQMKLMPQEYRLGAAPEDFVTPEMLRRRLSRSSSQKRSRKRDNFNEKSQDNHHHHHHHQQQQQNLPSTIENSQNEINYEQSLNQHNNQEQNVSDTRDQCSLSCSPSPQPNDTVLTVACLDKALDPEYTEQETDRIVPQSKFVYRDSIENRYLFPTDEPIDSTLEADLENLSQARYGQRKHSRSSRSIFKSLRSLVSCLSSHSSPSELDRHSENTMRFSHNSVKGTDNRAAPPQNREQPSELQCCSVNHKNETCYFPNDKIKLDESEGKLSLRHKSSSSDCGFSSASQNSINFQSYPTFSPVLMNTELVYKRIIARLMSSTTLTYEDTLKLKRILLEPQFDNSCANQSVYQNVTSTMDTNEVDHILADIIQRTYLSGGSTEQKHGCQLNNCPASECCRSPSDNIDTYPSANVFKMFGGTSKIQHSSIDHFCGIAQTIPQKGLKNGSSTSGSDTFSSHDSVSTAALVSDLATDRRATQHSIEEGQKDSIKSEEKSITANLPKAFELKLTLSINSDKGVGPQVETLRDKNTRGVNPDSNASSGDSTSSTLNINVTANQNESSQDEHSRSKLSLDNIVINSSAKTS